MSPEWRGTRSWLLSIPIIRVQYLPCLTLKLPQGMKTLGQCCED